MVTRIGTHEAHKLLQDGAQALEVLPESDHRSEHLPGAVSLPLTHLTVEAVAELDRERPLVAYCYDTQCDLSGRAAARLEHLGFTRVYDYTGSKAAWLAMGRPSEGTTPPGERAGAVAVPAVTCGPDTPIATLPDPGPGGVVVVVDADGIVLGAIDPTPLDGVKGGDLDAFDIAAPGPTTVRPSITVDELARSMDESGETHVIVSDLEGVLLGVVERSALRVDR